MPAPRADGGLTAGPPARPLCEEFPVIDRLKARMCLRFPVPRVPHHGLMGMRRSRWILGLRPGALTGQQSGKTTPTDLRSKRIRVGRRGGHLPTQARSPLSATGLPVPFCFIGCPFPDGRTVLTAEDATQPNGGLSARTAPTAFHTGYQHDQVTLRDRAAAHPRDEGAGTKKAGLAIAYRLLDPAQQRWRPLQRRSRHRPARRRAVQRRNPRHRRRSGSGRNERPTPPHPQQFDNCCSPGHSRQHKLCPTLRGVNRRRATALHNRQPRRQTARCSVEPDLYSTAVSPHSPQLAEGIYVHESSI